jgi:calcium-dependent protein kinase
MWTGTGTHFYCAPEIYNGGGYNYKIDIWATGVSYHLYLPKKDHHVSMSNRYAPILG